jgi:hypothetical protein
MEMHLGGDGWRCDKRVLAERGRSWSSLKLPPKRTLAALRMRLEC